MTHLNSPFREGILEVAFENSDPTMNLTLPGLFYSKIGDAYPVIENISNFTYNYPVGNGSFSTFTSPLSRFKSNENTLVQIGKDFFAYNTLPPYKEREVTKKEMIRLLNLFAELNGTRLIKYISVKLLNQFVFPKGTNIDSKFEFSITKSKIEEAQSHSALFSVAEFIHEGNTAALKFQTVNGLEGADTYSLELSYINFSKGEVTIENLEAWLDKGYALLVKMFNSSLTPELAEEYK
jgi:uncharacterized protein (TIGR04255 family)